MAGAVLGGIEGVLYKNVRAERNHRVPEVNRNFDNDFNRNLGNFENPWNDNNAVLSFCNLFISPTIYQWEFCLPSFFSSHQAFFLSHLGQE